MVWIASNTVTGTLFGYSFTSIPQTFTHLQLRIFGKNVGTSGTSDQLWLQFNGDTASNYSYHRLTGDGATPASAGFATQAAAYIGYTPTNATGYTNMFGNTVIDILDYTNTNKNKTVRSLSGFDLNGAGTVGLHSASWMSTSAITSLLISSNINSFSIGTRFDLYGITSSQVTGA